MKISNLRKERRPQMGGGKTLVISDLRADFNKEVKELYFEVDDKYGDWLTDDVYDAFLVAAIYPAMYYHESIEIEGKVSKKLYNNIVNYVQAIVRDFAPSTHQPVEIKVQGFADAKKNEQLHIGTGFSGGVDSFSTLTDRFFNIEDSDYKVDTLFFFHLGQYGNVKDPVTHERAINRFQITKDFASEVGLMSVMLDTNLFELYKPDWEYKAGVLNRICAVLVFQKALKRYYISNAYTYGEMIDLAHDRVFLEEFADPYIMPLLSPVGLEIVCDGAQYKRTEKTMRIANFPLAQKHLNVCVNSSDGRSEAINCSVCSKCMRTMMALESMNMLDKFSGVFDINKYHKHKFEYKCKQLLKYNKDGFAQDNVDFAIAHGNKMPSLLIARIYIAVLWIAHLPFRIIRKLIRMIKH